jgi:hypothetical protein
MEPKNARNKQVKINHSSNSSNTNGQLNTPANLRPWKELPVPHGWETVCAPEMVWALWSRQQYLITTRNRAGFVDRLALSLVTSVGYIDSSNEFRENRI